MDDTSGARTSIWLDTAEIPSRRPLGASTDTDVCVIGAGIAGLTTAYRLVHDGRSVIVLEDGEIASGETGRTTAHLVTALDDLYKEIRRLHGEDGARLAAGSHAAAIDYVEKIVTEEGIDCDFERVDGYLFLGPSDPVSLLDQELDVARQAGLDLRKISRAPVDSFDSGPCLHFPRQAQFHPLRYLIGMARAIEARGGRICTGTHASTIRGGPEAHVRTAEGHVVRARHIVVATNTPVNDVVTMHTKQAAYRTYVVGVALEAGAMPHVLLWDTPDPYHYVRVANGPDGKDVLIVGGEDHKTGQDENEDADTRFKRLLEWTRKRFPVKDKPLYKWSGQVMEPIDAMAFIGRNPGDAENVYIATGDSGNGMTHGTIAGLLITDLIAGRENPWAKLYDPSRITPGAAKEFARENLNVAAQYGDLVTGGEVDSTEQIARGSGAIVRRGLSKVAVYRDSGGTLIERSAICTHLGCVVRWNDGEKSWDCPCHGSRFDPQGKVLNGPAIKDLKPVDDDRAG